MEARQRINEGEFFKRCMDQLEVQIVKMNQDQLQSGLDAKGNSLPPYSIPYARKKGKSLTPKTLKDTGAFYDKFFSKAYEDYIIVGSGDPKMGILEGKWGKIHGLTEENLDEVRKLLIPIMVRELKTELGL